MRNLTEFHELVWHNQAPIVLSYWPDEKTEAEEWDLLNTRFYPDDLGPSQLTNIRIDNLLVSGINAIRDRHDLSKSDVIRALIRLGMAQLDGEFVNPAEQQSFPLDKLGGVGGRAPDDSKAARTSANGGGRTAPRSASPSQRPHAKQNPEAA